VRRAVLVATLFGTAACQGRDGRTVLELVEVPPRALYCTSRESSQHKSKGRVTALIESSNNPMMHAFSISFFLQIEYLYV
jgi:hypothetical protein